MNKFFKFLNLVIPRAIVMGMFITMGYIMYSILFLKIYSFDEPNKLIITIEVILITFGIIWYAIKLWGELNKGVEEDFVKEKKWN